MLSFPVTMCAGHQIQHVIGGGNLSLTLVECDGEGFCFAKRVHGCSATYFSGTIQLAVRRFTSLKADFCPSLKIHGRPNYHHDDPDIYIDIIDWDIDMTDPELYKDWDKARIDFDNVEDGDGVANKALCNMDQPVVALGWDYDDKEPNVEGIPSSLGSLLKTVITQVDGGEDSDHKNTKYTRQFEDDESQIDHGWERNNSDNSPLKP